MKNCRPSSPDLLSVNHREFAKALTLLARIIKPRSSKPALTWVILESQDDTLCLTGYDYEFGLELGLPGLGQALPRIAVSLDSLRRVLSSLESACELRLAEGKLQVLEQNRLQGEVPLENWREEYPQDVLHWPAANTGFPCPWLGPILAMAQGFVAEEATRYAIAHASVEFSPEHTRVSATDGRMLFTEDHPGGSGQSLQCLIPRSPLFCQAAIQDQLQSAVATPTILFLFGTGYRLQIRLGEGRYPRIEDVIPARTLGPVALTQEQRARLHQKLRHFPEQVLLVIKDGQAALHPVEARMAPLVVATAHTKLALRMKLNRELLRTCLSLPVDSLAWEQQPGPLVLTGEHGRRRVLLMPIGD